jgi:hypothetical protein
LSKKRNSSKTHTKSSKATRKFLLAACEEKWTETKKEESNKKEKNPHCRVS